MKRPVRGEGKCNLLKAATKLFARSGYDAVTVADISDQARANVSLIRFYFGGKEGLLVEVLNQLSTDQMTEAVRIFKDIKTKKELKTAVTHFLSSLVETLRSQKLVIKILFDQVELGRREAKVAVEQVFGLAHRNLAVLFEDQKKTWMLPETVDSEILAFQFLAPFLALIRSEYALKEYTDISLDNQESVDQLIEQTVRSVDLL